jgi:hypothetical protein
VYGPSVPGTVWTANHSATRVIPPDAQPFSLSVLARCCRAMVGCRTVPGTDESVTPVTAVADAPYVGVRRATLPPPYASADACGLRAGCGRSRGTWTRGGRAVHSCSTCIARVATCLT